MSNPIKSILISAGALTLIAGAATAALAGTNALTAARIAQNTAEVANAARRTVIDATDFTENTVTLADGSTLTYHVATKDGATAGYVFTAAATGKSAGLVVMTGIDTDGTVTGVTVTEENETAGYLDKVTKGGLFSAFVGKGDTADVDTISQATKTSKGVIAGVDKALAYVDEVVK